MAIFTFYDFNSVTEGATEANSAKCGKIGLKFGQEDQLEDDTVLERFELCDFEEDDGEIEVDPE